MKKALVLFAILVLALAVLVGCGGDSDDTSPVPLPSEKSSAKSAPSAPAEEPSSEPEPAAPKVTSEVATLLAKHTKRNIKGMQYLYTDPISSAAGDWWFIQGDKVGIELYTANTYNREDHLTHVYMDMGSKTAVGYCEDRLSARCEDPNKATTLRFSDYERLTPIDWIKRVTYAEKTGGETIDNRAVTKLEYDEDGAHYILYVDEYYGLPIRVKVDGGPEEGDYNFIDFSSNVVDDEKVSHQHISTD